MRTARILKRGCGRSNGSTRSLLPGAWTVIRVDGRGFSRFTEQRFDKPFDARFSELMVDTAQALLTEFGGRYAYTESDEISLLLDPAWELFGREVEKLVSLSAGIASAAFTHGGGEPAHFDSRAWLGTGPADVRRLLLLAAGRRGALRPQRLVLLDAAQGRASSQRRRPKRAGRRDACRQERAAVPARDQLQRAARLAAARRRPVVGELRRPATTRCAAPTSRPPAAACTSNGNCR